MVSRFALTQQKCGEQEKHDFTQQGKDRRFVFVCVVLLVEGLYRTQLLLILNQSTLDETL